jgi:hypothetical protein
LTHADAEALINRCPFPPSYAINLLWASFRKIDLN